MGVFQFSTFKTYLAVLLSLISILIEKLIAIYENLSPFIFAALSSLIALVTGRSRG